MSNIIVIGGSAGSIEPLRTIVQGLPAALPATIFVTIHISPTARSALPRIISKAGPLPAQHAVDGEAFLPGHIYIAPPDHHLSLSGMTTVVKRGPRENRNRPSIDVLFRSAAEHFGSRTLGILLSGLGEDGVAGLLRIKEAGGTIAIQEAEDAAFPALLLHAAGLAHPDYVLPASELGPLIARCVFKELSAGEVTEMVRMEDGLAGKHPTEFSCPECGGVLWKDDGHETLSLRCRVGHAYSYDSLLAAQSQGIEMALWAGLRALEEKAALLRRLAETTRERNQNLAAGRFDAAAEELEAPANVFRKLLLDTALYDQPDLTEET